MIDAKQIRAARGLLDWTQETLAEMSGVARTTIKNVENGSTLPRLETSNALQRTLEEAGVEFTPSSGVRMKDRMVQIFEGSEVNQRLLDDVYHTLRNTGGEVLIAHVDEMKFVNALPPDGLQDHLSRLEAANIKERLLVRKGDRNLVAPLEAYRAIADEYFSSHPFYIYGSKLALLCREPPEKAIVIDDERFADAIRKLFNFIWDRTEMPSHKDIQAAKAGKR